MDDTNLIEKEETAEEAKPETTAEQETEQDLGSLVGDTVHCVAAERERIERATGERYNGSRTTGSAAAWAPSPDWRKRQTAPLAPS